MAHIRKTQGEKVYAVKRWKGLNEGGATELGEASLCRNFTVRAEGALVKRGGTRCVAALTSPLRLGEAEESQSRETGRLTEAYTLYPLAEATATGVRLGGAPVTVDAAQAAAYGGWFRAAAGTVQRLEGVTFRERELVERVPRANFIGTDSRRCYVLAYEDLLWDGTAYVGTEPQVTAIWDLIWNSPRRGGWVASQEGGTPATLWTTETPRAEDFAPLIGADGLLVWLEDNGEGGNLQENAFTVGARRLVYRERAWALTWRTLLQVANTGADPAVKALWQGYVAGREVVMAAAHGFLWALTEEDGVWTKTNCGNLDTGGRVTLFGFEGRLYALNGSQYRVWDGTFLVDVQPYVPLVRVAVPPNGVGKAGEAVNLLTPRRRVRFSPDGTAKTFHLPEPFLHIWPIRDLATGETLTGGYRVNPEEGTVVFDTAPAQGVSTLEMTYTAPEDDSALVRGMTLAELSQDGATARLYLYGDGTNRVLRSAASATYFPADGVLTVGDANTPVTALLRHYSALLCFKTDSAWLLTADGAVPVNRDAGCCAYGGAVLCENRPRTLDGRSVLAWKSLPDGEREAERVSGRVERSLAALDLGRCRPFYNKRTHEYTLLDGEGNALVENLALGLWTRWDGPAATCLLDYRDEVYLGTREGELLHLSPAYPDDCGRPIPARWESGALDFGAESRRKFTAALYVALQPQTGTALSVRAVTDRESLEAEGPIGCRREGALPEVRRVRLRARGFTHLKLILESDGPGPVGVLSATLRVRSAGFVRS